MTRKADRFDRLAQDIWDELQSCSRCDTDDMKEFHLKSIVSKLLHNEHAWFKRMVKQQAKDIGVKTGWWDGYSAACKDILTRLTQRRG